MPSPENRVCLIVRSLGPVAANVLGGDGDLRAIAVFDRSFYAVGADGGAVCFLRGTMEEGPLHALCDGWPTGMGEAVAVGDVLARRPGAFLGRKMFLDVSRARRWTPPPPPLAVPEAALRGLRFMERAVRRHAPGGALLRRWLFPDERGDAGDAPGDILFAETTAGLDAFRQWFGSRDEPSRREAFRRLIGLGPGLTPSGDDIVAGLVFALRGCGEEADAFAADLSARAAGTNALSRAHMAAAAEGLAAAPFHEALSRALSGEDADEQVRRIGGIGHSSGWDCLLGIMQVLMLVFPGGIR